VDNEQSPNKTNGTTWLKVVYTVVDNAVDNPTSC
jgi:hypothetical protein